MNGYFLDLETGGQENPGGAERQGRFAGARQGFAPGDRDLGLASVEFDHGPGKVVGQGKRASRGRGRCRSRLGSET